MYDSKRLIILLIILLFSCLPSFARRLGVPDQFDTIQEAIDNSQFADTILVERGRYEGRINFNGNSVTLASRFILSQDQEDITETIIDGVNVGGSVIVIRSFEQAVVTGFTVTGGDTDFGGAIYCRQSNAEFSYLIVEENTTSRNGAGIYCTQNANVNINNVVFRNNEAGYVGGGFGCYGGSNVTISNSVFYDNYCDHVGGAMHCHSATLTLQNVTAVNNVALHSGGALYLTQGGTATTNDCILYDNQPHEVYVMSGNEFTLFTPRFSNIKNGVEGMVILDEVNLGQAVEIIDIDSEFEDPDNNDFTLSEGSPCIDTGNPESNPDPDNTRSDMGAFYFHQEEGGSSVLNVPDEFDTIQEAIDEADEGDFILVQEGNYRENLECEDTGLTISSRFFTTGDPDFLVSTVIEGNNLGRVLNVQNIGTLLRVSGFTISGGLSEGDGGGIRALNSSVILEHLFITRNQAADGGGIHLGESSGIINEVHVENNTAQTAGGISWVDPREGDDLEYVIKNIIVSGNTSEENCGGISLVGVNVNFANIQITSNVTMQGGGALNISDCDPVIRNTLIALNESSGNSGIVLQESNPTFVNLTIASNSSNDEEAGVFNATASEADFSNSIFWGNEPPIIAGVEESSLAIDYSLIQGGEENIEGFFNLNFGENNLDENPNFFNPGGGDFHLIIGSPCIDAGDPDSPRDPDGTISEIGALFFRQEFEFARLFSVPEEYETIQEAIDVCQSGDTVLVSPGRYVENLEFRGDNIIVGSLFLTTRNPDFILETIIDGNDESRVVSITRGEWDECQLSGFTIENGAGREGGGIFVYNAWPTISYCLIKNNRAEDGGGGVYCYGGGPSLSNCTIVNNESETANGGLFGKNMAYFSLYNCILWNNENAQIEFSAEMDMNTVVLEYCLVEDGEQGINTNFNGNVTWEVGNIGDDPSFVDIDNEDFHLSEDSPCINAGDPEAHLDPDGTINDIGAIPFDHGGDDVIFDINLRDNWNLISTPVPPLDYSMRSIWNEVVEAENLLLVKNHRGRFYRPMLNFDNLHTWEIRYGYWVKMANRDQLTLTNRPVDPEISIPLDRGWTNIAYFPEKQVDARDAFENILDELVLAKDDDGRFYLPSWNFNNLRPLRWGKGYQVRVNEDVDLVWNVPEDGFNYLAAIDPLAECVHFPGIYKSPTSMNILLNPTDAIEFKNYSELAVFTEEGLCVGSMVLENSSPWGLAIWGDDPTTKEIDGATESDVLEFRLFDGKSEYSVQLGWIEGKGEFKAGEVLIADIPLIYVPLKFDLSQPYPNPFNSTARLNYTIPETGEITFDVFDISGRLVENVYQGNQVIGVHQLVLNSSNWSSGIYFLHLETEANYKTVKLICIK